MADKMFGWDLIYNVSENDLNKKEDVLTLLIHFTLIRNGYRCIGLGDDKVLTGAEKSSELLPKGWNSSKNYSLRYVRKEDVFILRGVPVDENMVFNLLNGSNLSVSNAAFNVNNSILATRGPLETMVPTAEEISAKIKSELIDPHCVSVNKEATTQTTKAPSAGQPGPPDPVPIRPAIPNLMPPGSVHVDPFWSDPERDPQRVGRRDLDPFASGGGMIFNPFDPRGGIPDPGAGIPGGLPRGSLPPGARFDPFGPPGAGRGPRRPPDMDFDPGYYM